jgi:hypothetical protein
MTQMHILGAIAEFERARMAERVKAGLQRARAEGTQLGRPRQAPPVMPVAGGSVREAARAWGVSKSTAARRINAGRAVLSSTGAASRAHSHRLGPTDRLCETLVHGESFIGRPFALAIHGRFTTSEEPAALKCQQLVGHPQSLSIAKNNMQGG